MILVSYAHDLYEVRLAFLQPLVPGGPDKARYFSESDQLVSYLKLRPNHKFTLTEKTRGELLINSPPDAYGPEHGDVLCGDEVYFDPALNRIASNTQIGRKWTG